MSNDQPKPMASDKTQHPGGEIERTLRNLVAPAEQQREYLERLGTPDSADELALEFDDALKRPDTTVLLNRLPRAAAVIARLHQELTGFSGRENEDMWTLRALAEDEQWARVRQLARKALSELTDGL